MKRWIVTVASASLAFAVQAIQSADLPTSLKVKSIGYAGSGCPQGTLSVKLNPVDGAVVYEPDIIAQVGKGIKPASQRSACTVEVRLGYTAGWQYAVESFLSDSMVELSNGNVTAQLSVSYFFSGVPGEASQSWDTNSSFNGSVSTIFGDRAKAMHWNNGSNVFNPSSVPANSTLNHVTIHGKPVWSPCGGEGTVNVKTSASLKTRDPSAAAAFVVPRSSFSFMWRKCNWIMTH